MQSSGVKRYGSLVRKYINMKIDFEYHVGNPREIFFSSS